MAAGAFAVEIDVWISSDLQPVVVHDPVLNARDYCLAPLLDTREQAGISARQGGTPAGCTDAKVFSHEASKLQLVTFGDEIEGVQPHIPTLRNLLSSPGIDPTRINIELKSIPAEVGNLQPDISTYIEAVLRVLTEFERPWRIQSFDHRLIEHLREARPHWSLHFLTEGDRALSSHDPLLLQVYKLNQVVIDTGEFDRTHPGVSPKKYGICCAVNQVNQALIEHCRIREIPLSVYTVNDRQAFVDLYNVGLRDIITDDPQGMLKLAADSGWLLA